MSVFRGSVHPEGIYTLLINAYKSSSALRGKRRQQDSFYYSMSIDFPQRTKYKKVFTYSRRVYRHEL